jgi:3'-5' exoribonuclease
MKHPAGRSMHHAYQGGLLEHTVHMLRVATRIIDIYPSVRKDIALAGIVVHDLGKIREYEFNLTAERNQEGNFLGHVVLGLSILEEGTKLCPLSKEKLLQLQHIVASHMQKPEWGAASLPATPEAVFVSMVDNLDAKMAMTEKTYDQTTPGTFGMYHKGLSTCLWRDSV